MNRLLLDLLLAGLAHPLRAAVTLAVAGLALVAAAILPRGGR